MSSVLEYPATELADSDYHAFNLAVWEKLIADPVLTALDFRIETDRYGQIIMSPPPTPSHGNRQSEIGHLLRLLRPDGKVISECPVSTSDGVKAVDVAWCSAEEWERLGERACFLKCPKICVEVWSPSNTRRELEDKKRLCFEAGATEVWLCERDGRMKFFLTTDGAAEFGSSIAPGFPENIE